MCTLAIIFYVFVFIASGYNPFWPITLLIHGDKGDKAIAVAWILLLVFGLCRL